MQLKEYQRLTPATAVYPEEVALPYLALGLGNEAGEVQGKIKKYLRGDYPKDEMLDAVRAELGDVMWYMSQLANELDIDLEYVIEENIRKLQSRKERNVLKGNGDAR